jgi:hypothetical protein
MKNWAAYAVVALAYLGYNVVTSADRDDSGTITGQGSIDAFEIRVGDCFDDTSSGFEEVTDLPGVPCSEPHDNEAFAVFNLTMANYPGDTMAELAYDSCMERFEPFVGNEYESSTLEILTLYPTISSWQQSDREVICAVYDMNDEKLQGSAKGRAL